MSEENVLRKKRVLVDLDRLRELTSGLGHVALYLGERLARRASDINDMHFTYLVPSEFVGYFGSDVDYMPVKKWHKFFPYLHPQFDLWYCPHQDISHPPKASAQFIMTINDLNFLKEKSPRRCAVRLKRIQKFIDRAAALTAISQTTAAEIRSHLSVENKPLHVLPCGLELKIFTSAKQPNFIPQRPFFLTVGVHKHTKNYRALVSYMEKMPEYDLVMLGQYDTPAGRELVEQVKKSSCPDRIHLRGIVSEEDKFWYYSNCTGVLFPSISEGMGYPPLEGMQARKPAFVFRESSVPETCGPHAFYWSSQDPQIMANETREKLDWLKGHPEFIEHAYVHGMSFGWDPVVEKYIQLFRSVLF